MRVLSGYRMMWLIVLFDLPVGTNAQRRAATRFRNELLEEGFEMSQFSVYVRFCASQNVAQTLMRKIAASIPQDGRVHIVPITDKQYEKIWTFRGRRQVAQEKPSQFLLL